MGKQRRLSELHCGGDHRELENFNYNFAGLTSSLTELNFCNNFLSVIYLQFYTQLSP